MCESRPKPAAHHLSDALAQVGERRSEGEDGHNLAADRDVELGLALDVFGVVLPRNPLLLHPILTSVIRPAHSDKREGVATNKE